MDLCLSRFLHHRRHGVQHRREYCRRYPERLAGAVGHDARLAASGGLQFSFCASVFRSGLTAEWNHPVDRPAPDLADPSDLCDWPGRRLAAGFPDRHSQSHRSRRLSMGRYLKLYLWFWAQRLKVLLEYPGSTLLDLCGQILTQILGLLVIFWVVIRQVPGLGG